MKKFSEEFSPIIIIPMDIEDIDSRVKQTQYWVKVDTDMYYELWNRFAYNAYYADNYPQEIPSRVWDWKTENETLSLPVFSWYNINIPETKHSSNIDIKWAIINNVRVGFYTSSGNVSHSEMLEYFLKLHFESYRVGLHKIGNAFHPKRMMEEIELREN